MAIKLEVSRGPENRLALTLDRAHTMARDLYQYSRVGKITNESHGNMVAFMEELLLEAMQEIKLIKEEMNKE